MDKIYVLEEYGHSWISEFSFVFYLIVDLLLFTVLEIMPHDHPLCMFVSYLYCILPTLEVIYTIHHKIDQILLFLTVKRIFIDDKERC